MWTNHEISRKASPWSSGVRPPVCPSEGPRQGPGRPAAPRRELQCRELQCRELPARRGHFALLLLLAFLLPLVVLPAQEGERKAILLQGPNLTRGVPAIGPNAFEAQRARYELSSGEEVELYLLSVVVSRVDQWGSFSCPLLAGPGVTLNARQGDSALYAYRSENEGRTLLLLGTTDSDRACDFLSAFLEELAFFSSALGPSPLLPFPGVLTY